MNEVQKLQQDINALQNQLRYQNQQAEISRQRIIQENRAALQRYQADMNRAIREHDENTKQEYERLLNEYKKSLNGELDKEIASLDSDYRKLLENTMRTEQELKNKTAQLEETVKSLKKANEKREQDSKNQAAGCIKGAVAVFKNIEKKPHAKFAPRRLKIYYDELNDAKSLYDANLFEASAAVAISVDTGLKRLGFTIDDLENEWRGLFELFVLRIDYLHSKISNELNEWHRFAGGIGIAVGDKRRERLTELNFWSYGEYERIVSKMMEYKKISDDIKKIGIENYLSDENGIDVDTLRNNVDSLELLGKEFDMLMPLCRSRYSASCERTELGEKIIDFLCDEINLVWHDEKSGFRIADGKTLADKSFTKYINICMGDGTMREDFREWLRLVFENAAGNMIYLYIIPTENAPSVKNRIVLHINYSGTQQPAYTHDICSHVCEAVGVPFNERNDGTGLVTAMQNVDGLKQSRTKTLQNMAKDIEKISSEK